jgi:L-lactate dehydrogenase (cytochrome)
MAHPPSEALPAIVAAVGEKIEVWMDGGIRSPAKTCSKPGHWAQRGTMIGRAMVYGLGAMGEAGVARALQIIQKELEISMAFCGHTQIESVDRAILIPGSYPLVGSLGTP